MLTSIPSKLLSYEVSGRLEIDPPPPENDFRLVSLKFWSADLDIMLCITIIEHIIKMFATHS